LRILRALATSIVFAAALSTAAANFPAAAEGGAADSLEAVIAEHRYRLRYAEAIAAARELLRVRRNDPGTPAHEIENTEWLIQGLGRIASLPAASQQKLAHADSLQKFLESTVVGNEAGGSALAEEWLGLVEEVLGPRWRELITVHSRVGEYHFYDGHYKASETHLRQALKLAYELLGPDHPFFLECLSNLAVPLVAMGDLAGAEVLLRDALERKQRLYGPRDENLIPTSNNLAAVLEGQGDDLGAETLARSTIDLVRARNLDNGIDPDMLIVGHVNRLARILRREGDMAGAEETVRDAIRIHQTWYADQPFAFDLSVSYLVLGDVLADEHDLAGAAGAQERALEICRHMKGDGHPEVARYMMSKAETYLRRGEAPEAEDLLRQALEINRRNLGKLHPQTCRNLTLLGRAMKIQGRLLEAEVVLTEAAASFDVARLSGRGSKRALLPLLSPYTDLALVRLAVGRQEDAWIAAERGLARTLADLLFASDRRQQAPKDAAREDSLAMVLTNLEGACEALPAAPSSAQGGAGGAGGEAERQAEVLRSRLARAQADWAALQEQFAARYPVTPGGTYSIARIQSAIPLHAALIGWLEPLENSGSSERWAYVVRASGPIRWVRLSPATVSGRTPLRADLDEAASWPVRVPLSAAVGQHARSLWNEYLAPLRNELDGVDHLYIIASGGLLGVPIEAAQDESGRWAIDRFTISYVPSATVHAWLKDQKRARPAVPRREMKALLVGDPPFAREPSAPSGDGGASLSNSVMGKVPSVPPAIVWRSAVAGNPDALDRLPRLPGSREEISRVKSLLPSSQVLLGQVASERAIADLAAQGRLREFRILHFATHALVDDRAPERSAVVLSRVDLPDPVEAALQGKRVYDGMLRAVEITREWRLDADLVTLSGCQTGLGKEAPGEGYLGLVHAFLQVGARSLLVSLWQVDDRAAALLMGRFYENLTRSVADERSGRGSAPMSKSEALREAKLWLRNFEEPTGTRPYEHPVYWSPFVLIGDPD